MPVIRDFRTNLNLEEAGNLRAIRGQHGIHPRMLAILPEILAEIDSQTLINPQISYDIIGVRQVTPGHLELDNGSTLSAPVLSHKLARASGLAIGVITIGRTISEAISASFSKGSSLKAIIMEEIANTLLFKTADYFQAVIDENAALRGLQASGQLAPGNDGFDFSQQPTVLNLAGADQIGVKLSAMGVMNPIHSTSVLIGIGKRMRRWSQEENCQTCPSHDKCVHRNESTTVAACT